MQFHDPAALDRRRPVTVRRTVHAAARRVWREYRSQRSAAIAPAPFVPNPLAWPDRGLHAAWLGHSTVLLKIDGFTILTDPVLGDRCGLSFGRATIGLKRLVAPALARPADLPPIDLILLSHAHLDHFDKPTLRLFENPATSVVTAHRTSDLLRTRRYRGVDELAWGRDVRLGPALVRAFPVKHWGARMHRDSYRGYNGYVVEVGNRRVVFGGDTAYTSSFRSLRAQGPVDLAIVPIGAYDPWIHVHCNPEQAMEMGNDCGAEFLLPVHHRTFRLSREPLHEPIERFLAAAGNFTDRVPIRDIGQQWSMP